MQIIIELAIEDHRRTHPSGLVVAKLLVACQLTAVLVSLMGLQANRQG